MLCTFQCTFQCGNVLRFCVKTEKRPKQYIKRLKSKFCFKNSQSSQTSPWTNFPYFILCCNFTRRFFSCLLFVFTRPGGTHDRCFQPVTRFLPSLGQNPPRGPIRPRVTQMAFSYYYYVYSFPSICIHAFTRNMFFSDGLLRIC
jgi:hypothetical protein